MQTNLDKDQLQFHQLVCKVFPFPSDISCILMITPSEHVRFRRAHFNFSINQLALAPSFPFKTLTFSLICLIRLTFTFLFLLLFVLLLEQNWPLLPFLVAFMFVCPDMNAYHTFALPLLAEKCVPITQFLTAVFFTWSSVVG